MNKKQLKRTIVVGLATLAIFWDICRATCNNTDSLCGRNWTSNGNKYYFF